MRTWRWSSPGVQVLVREPRELAALFTEVKPQPEAGHQIQCLDLDPQPLRVGNKCLVAVVTHLVAFLLLSPKLGHHGKFLERYAAVWENNFWVCPWITGIKNFWKPGAKGQTRQWENEQNLKDILLKRNQMANSKKSFNIFTHHGNSKSIWKCTSMHTYQNS